MEVNCDICNILFFKTRHNVVRSKKHYCSNQCKYKKSEFCALCSKRIDRNIEKRSKIYCNKCYEKNYYMENPKRVLLRRKRARENLRKKRNLPLNTPRMRAEDGSGFINSNGYKIISIKNHPNAKNGRIAEHTLIMSEHIGRPLFENESIHHKNGIRDDNRIENLELWTNYPRPGRRLEDQISWCIEFLNKYGYEVKLFSL